MSRFSQIMGIALALNAFASPLINGDIDDFLNWSPAENRKKQRRKKNLRVLRKINEEAMRKEAHRARNQKEWLRRIRRHCRGTIHVTTPIDQAIADDLRKAYNESMMGATEIRTPITGDGEPSVSDRFYQRLVPTANQFFVNEETYNKFYDMAKECGHAK